MLLQRDGGPVFKSLRPGARPDGFELPEELTHDPRSGGADPGDMSAELGAEELREIVRRCVASMRLPLLIVAAASAGMTLFVATALVTLRPL